MASFLYGLTVEEAYAHELTSITKDITDAYEAYERDLFIALGYPSFLFSYQKLKVT
jgi:hypothetical protein